MSPVTRIQPATGLDTEASVEYVGAAAAPGLRNLLSHKPGRLIQRGGLGKSVAFTTNGAGPIVGPWVFDDKMVFVAPDAAGVTKAHYATMNADGSITYGGNQAVTAYPRLSAFARVGDFVYGPGTLVAGGDAILQWAGQILQTFVVASTAVFPQQASDYANYAERLFVLNGTVPGTTTPVLNNRLFWSDPGGPTTLTDLNQWKDDVSGLVNQLVLPDAGVALAALPSSLGIFCKNSVHVLTGTGSSNFTRKQVLYRGATNRDAVCPYGEGVYFLSRDGLFYFDGSQERKVSGAVESKTTQLEGVAMTGYVRDVGNGYLYVGIYDNGTRRWEGLFHTRAGTWTELTFAAVLSGGVAQIAAFNGHVVMIDKLRLFNASGLTSPGATLPRGRDATTTTGYAIDTRWQTRAVRLGSPFNKAHVRRIVIDYAWVCTDPAACWSYVVYTSPADLPNTEVVSSIPPGGAVLTPTTLKTGTLTQDGSDSLTRRRAVIEVRAEAENLWLELSANLLPSDTTVAELYDIWIEYDVAQQSKGY